MNRRWVAALALGLALAMLGSPPGQSQTHDVASDSTITFIRPVEGATVSGVTPVQLRTDEGVDWIGVFACDGSSVGEDLVEDEENSWSVQWDTQIAGCTNGRQELSAWAFDTDGTQLAEARITVVVHNEGPPPEQPPPEKCEARGEPAPVAGEGYEQTFADCFGALDRTVWCSHQWWEPAPPLGAQYTGSRGILHLVRRRADGYPNITLSSEPCGQPNPQSFQEGYFEARMKWTGRPGSGPAFWLLSTAHATNPKWPEPACGDPTCLSAEIDIFEGYGNRRDVFTGTIHRNSCNCYEEADEQNVNSWQPLEPQVDLSAGWHVYAARWTASAVTWYLDDQPVMTAPVYDSTDQPMHIVFYNWSTPWQNGNEPEPPLARRLETLVDWVRVWQR